MTQQGVIGGCMGSIGWPYHQVVRGNNCTNQRVARFKVVTTCVCACARENPRRCPSLRCVADEEAAELHACQQITNHPVVCVYPLEAISADVKTK